MKADDASAVAGAAEQLRHVPLPVMEIPGEVGLREPHDAVQVRVAPGHDASPRRTALRRCREGAVEPHARLGQRIQVRGAHVRMRTTFGRELPLPEAMCYLAPLAAVSALTAQRCSGEVTAPASSGSPVARICLRRAASSPSRMFRLAGHPRRCALPRVSGKVVEFVDRVERLPRRFRFSRCGHARLPRLARVAVGAGVAEVDAHLVGGAVRTQRIGS